MANARGKTVDTTYLSIEQAEDRGFIHRDYIAHCLRWTHVVKKMLERGTYKTARILDVGCGRELPFIKTLYTARLIPEFYVGVDVGPIKDEAMETLNAGKMADRSRIYERTNILELDEGDAPEGMFTHAVCFEVLEHVEPKMMLQMLDKIKSLLAPDGTFYMSTPCWNRTDCAANHVNEMTYEALGACLEDNGWAILNMHGTFASIRDYVHLMPENHREVFEAMRSYYDVNYLSTIFAPLYPAQSRNVLWELTPVLDGGEAKYLRSFGPLSEQQKPWGSSEKWEEMQRHG